MQAQPTSTKGTGADYFIQFNYNKILEGFTTDKSQRFFIDKPPLSTAKQQTTRRIQIYNTAIPFVLEIEKEFCEYLNRGRLNIDSSEIQQLYIKGGMGELSFNKLKGSHTHIQSCRELRFYECNLGTVHIHGSVTEKLEKVV